MSTGGNGSLNTRFIPRIEGLEDRTVPAGNVQAVVFDGTLYVAGDDLGNQIQIVGVGERGALIQSLDGTTTINGRSEVFVGGIKRDLYVRMYGGDDQLIVLGMSHRGTMNIDMGDGDDILGISGARHRGASILATGSGDDKVVLHASLFRRPLTLNTGAGDDDVLVDGVTAVNAGLLNPAGTSYLDNRSGPSARFAANGFISGTRPAPAPTAPTIQDPTTPSTPTTPTAPDPTTPTTPTTPTAPDTTDTTAPTATVTAAGAGPTNSTPLTFTITFSEDVTGFEASKLVVTNGTADPNIGRTARTFVVQVAPAGQGPVSVSVPAGAVTDAAGNPNTASDVATTIFDSVAPVVAINGGTTNDNTPTITGTVDDPTAAVLVTVSGRTYLATVAGNIWSAEVTDPLTDGPKTVTATATDAAGNVGTAPAATLTVDATSPTLTFAAAPPSPTSANAVTVTITFSEPVTGFEDADVAVTGAGTKSNFQEVVPGLEYTVDVTRTGDGTAMVTVPAGAARDAADNPNEPLGFSVLFDQTNPVVMIDPAPTAAGTIAGTATDAPGSGVQSVEVSAFDTVMGMYYVSPGNYSAAETFLPATTADGFATWALSVPAGTYDVNARATDNAGNVGTDSVTGLVVI